MPTGEHLHQGSVTPRHFPAPRAPSARQGRLHQCAVPHRRRSPRRVTPPLVVRRRVSVSSPRRVRVSVRRQRRRRPLLPPPNRAWPAHRVGDVRPARKATARACRLRRMRAVSQKPSSKSAPRASTPPTAGARRCRMPPSASAVACARHSAPSRASLFVAPSGSSMRASMIAPRRISPAS